mgnify:CR=1 FL=1
MAELSLADLVRNGTMDEHVAATLWTIAEERRSFMVTAVPRFAGKSTVSSAMLEQVPKGTPVHVLSGDEDEMRELAANPDGGYLVVGELSRAPVSHYIWGQPVRTYFETVRAGFSLATAMHAPTPEDAFALIGDDNGVPDGDASLIEINPLVVTGAGDVLALDAKVTLDDNALFRRPALGELRDLAEEEELEVEASQHGLNYIRLDGTIGCMVNGAGLAMATMDIIKLAGGEPANFLDVGGGANAEQIRNAFRLLLSDTKVRAVLINIFGGILRCDVLADGVIAAVTELGVRVPVVIRMEGTNVDEGRRILRDSGLNFTTADSMGEAAQRVVELAASKSTPVPPSRPGRGSG